jgi:hypothetical protein
MDTLKENIDKLNHDIEEINSLESYGKAINIAFSLLAITGLIIDYIADCYVCDKNGGRILSRNEAIIGGNLIRLEKFQVKLLEVLHSGDLELSSIIIRIIAETGINLNFFINENSPEIFENYIKYSHRTLLKVKGRQKNLPKIFRAEKIVDKHIKNSFLETDLSEDEIDMSSRDNWSGKGGIYQRATKYGLKDIYEVLYSHTSHAVHGNWEDISTFHLKKKGKGYIGSFENVYPTCDLILGTISLNLTLIEKLVQVMQIDNSIKAELIRYHDEIKEKNVLLFIKTNLNKNER